VVVVVVVMAVEGAFGVCVCGSGCWGGLLLLSARFAGCGVGVAALLLVVVVVGVCVVS
jgi:hypothetical protein